jgi:DNA-directed RNA polymerase subunit RPC12/RpoP
MEIGEVKMKDKCVSCGVETLYDKTDHVDFRLGYVEGAGQLCLDCYEKIYMKPKKKEVKNENGTLV